MGFEPMTSSLPRKCSTPELRRLMFLFTGSFIQQFIGISGITNEQMN
jgi:hypothetical protein